MDWKKDMFLIYKVEDDVVIDLSYISKQLKPWRSLVRVLDKNMLVSAMLVLFAFSDTNIAFIGSALKLLCTWWTNDLSMIKQSDQIQFTMSSRVVGRSMERHTNFHKVTHLTNCSLSSSLRWVWHAKQLPSMSPGNCWAIAGEIGNERERKRDLISFKFSSTNKYFPN